MVTSVYYLASVLISICKVFSYSVVGHSLRLFVYVWQCHGKILKALCCMDVVSLFLANAAVTVCLELVWFDSKDSLEWCRKSPADVSGNLGFLNWK